MSQKEAKEALGPREALGVGSSGTRLTRRDGREDEGGRRSKKSPEALTTPCQENFLLVQRCGEKGRMT